MMYRKEVNRSSPLRILERSIHGGLGPGNLGVVMARAGVGKGHGADEPDHGEYQQDESDSFLVAATDEHARLPP